MSCHLLGLEVVDSSRNKPSMEYHTWSIVSSTVHLSGNAMAAGGPTDLATVANGNNNSKWQPTNRGRMRQAAACKLCGARRQAQLL